MDPQTLASYDSAAAACANDWHAQPEPADLHAIIRRFFKAGPTADVGCGSGREVAWLCANGFPAVGYDPSEGLLTQAEVRYPGLAFAVAALPDLTGLADESFDNVLCETVIMHLPHEEVAASVRRMMSILRPGGVLCLGWRVTKSADVRDGQGRYYAAFDAKLVRDALTSGTLLLDQAGLSASSGKAIHRIVARKCGNVL